jgi:hypothetical protein
MRYHNGEIVYVSVGSNNLIGSHKLDNSIASEKKPQVVSKSILHCSPNPFFGSLNLLLEEKFPSNKALNVYVYDIRGKLLYSDKLVINKKKNINLNSTASGIYVVRVTDGHRIVAQKPVQILK